MTKPLEFRANAVKQLQELKEWGVVLIDGVEIKSVRSLLSTIGTSSKSLYTWEKDPEVIAYLKPEPEPFIMSPEEKEEAESEPDEKMEEYSYYEKTESFEPESREWKDLQLKSAKVDKVMYTMFESIEDVAFLKTLIIRATHRRIISQSESLKALNILYRKSENGEGV